MINKQELIRTLEAAYAEIQALTCKSGNGLFTQTTLAQLEAAIKKLQDADE